MARYIFYILANTTEQGKMEQARYGRWHIFEEFTSLPKSEAEGKQKRRHSVVDEVYRKMSSTLLILGCQSESHEIVQDIFKPKLRWSTHPVSAPTQ